METSNRLCYWFLFYKDQLLLQKENDTYTIPYGENPPVPVSHTLEVDYRDGLPARTAELDTPYGSRRSSLLRLSDKSHVCKKDIAS